MTSDESVSKLPFTAGDRVELLSGCWYPGKVDRVVATGTNADVTIRYGIKLDGCSGTIDVTNVELLRSATTPDPFS